MEDYYKEKNEKVQKIKIIKKIFIKLIYIVVISIVIWDLIIIAKTVKNPSETPSVFGIKTFCIISGSMEPNISINDIVIIKEVPQNEINKGDVITFVVDGDVITHRVKEIQNQNGKLIYITQGDANNIEDADTITFEDIEGKCIAKIPKIGKIAMALKNKATLGIVLIILILVYFIEQKSDNKKIRRSEERIKYENKEK